MTEDDLSPELKKALDEAAKLIKDPAHNDGDEEGTLVAACDYLADAVEGLQAQNQRKTMLSLRMLVPTGGDADDNSRGRKGKGVREKSTPYEEWSQGEKDAFPKKGGSPDPSYMMLHLGSWCWYTSTGKKCYS